LSYVTLPHKILTTISLCHKHENEACQAISGNVGGGKSGGVVGEGWRKVCENPDNKHTSRGGLGEGGAQRGSLSGSISDSARTQRGGSGL